MRRKRETSATSRLFCPDRQAINERSPKTFVMPAKAGIHLSRIGDALDDAVDSRVRGNDE